MNRLFVRLQNFFTEPVSPHCLAALFYGMGRQRTSLQIVIFPNELVEHPLHFFQTGQVMGSAVGTNVKMLTDGLLQQRLPSGRERFL